MDEQTVSYHLHYRDSDGNEIAEPRPLATIKGWGDVGRWAESLDPETHGEIALLHRNGESDTLESLERELSDAIDHARPQSDDTLHTATDLLTSIKARPSNCESVSVGDGLGSDGDSDE